MFEIYQVAKGLGPSVDNDACRTGHLVFSLKVPRYGCSGLCLNAPSCTLNFSGKDRGRSIHIFVLRYDEAMRSSLSIQGKCEITRRLKYIYISNSLNANFVKF